MGFFKNKRVGDPKWIAGDEEHDAALAEYGVSVDALSRTSARPTRWLVQDIIPHEAVTLIAGDPGAGKTFFACQLAADATRVSRLRVVLAISGDESAEFLRWRLEKAEGDARRVALATLRPNGFYDKRGNPTAEELDERMAILCETLRAAGDPKSGILPAEINSPDDSFPTPRAAQLLVIDDIDGWFGKPGNLMPAAALARAIQRLNALARSLRVAVVVLARTQLSVEGRMTTRQLSRLSQAANVVWMVVKDREQGVGNRVQEEVLGLRSSSFDASGGEVESEDLRPKTEDRRPTAKCGRRGGGSGMRGTTTSCVFPKLATLVHAGEEQPEESSVASCACSAGSAEFEGTSCASSKQDDGNPSGAANCPHSGPGYPLAGAVGEETSASCASSVEVKKVEGSNCASSTPGAGASAAVERDANGNFENGEEGNPKSKIQNPKSKITDRSP